MAPVAVEGGPSPSVVVLMGSADTHCEGDVCGRAESLVYLRGPSPTSDGCRDELGNDKSTFVTGAIVMCTVLCRVETY